MMLLSLKKSTTVAEKEKPKMRELPVVSWVSTEELSWLQKQATTLLQCGPIPNHVSLILDGNRTYARNEKSPEIYGHRFGMETLGRVMFWGQRMGVKETTIYIFSLENFNRPKKQVNDLMRLAKESFVCLLDSVDKLVEEGTQVRMIGDWSYVPANMAAILAKTMILTRHCSKLRLNIAFAYTGRNEITRTCEQVMDGVRSGELKVEDLNVKLMDETMKIHSVQTDPDLLIRTSGVTRLSDFLLWQSNFTIMRFIDPLWPEFTFWEYWKAVFAYQVQYYRLQKYKIGAEAIGKLGKGKGEITERGAMFLQNQEEKYWQHIETLADYY